MYFGKKLLNTSNAYCWEQAKPSVDGQPTRNCQNGWGTVILLAFFLDTKVYISVNPNFYLQLH